MVDMRVLCRVLSLSFSWVLLPSYLAGIESGGVLVQFFHCCPLTYYFQLLYIPRGDGIWSFTLCHPINWGEINGVQRGAFSLILIIGNTLLPHQSVCALKSSLEDCLWLWDVIWVMTVKEAHSVVVAYHLWWNWCPGNITVPTLSWCLHRCPSGTSWRTSYSQTLNTWWNFNL